MSEKVLRPAVTNWLPWRWNLTLWVAFAFGGMLLIWNGPSLPPGMLSQVRPEGLWRLLGILIMAGVLTHYLIFAVLMGIDRLFKLDARSRQLENLWPPALLGLCESVLYPGAWIAGRADFIAVWLALKVAGEWQRWGTQGEDLDKLDEGRRRYTKFLIGNALMIAAGAITFEVLKGSVLQ